jgi:GNAT superfamily N-acetyltransferase
MTAAIADFEVRRDGFTISTERARLDLDAIYRYLSGESHWAAGMARGVFERSVAGALPFGLYEGGGAQIGYARVVSDYATFAWLSDVYVLEAWRGKGLGHFLIGTVMAHPRLQGLRRWMLSTRDAHRIYAEYGFGDVDPAALMPRIDREAYKRDG